MKIFVVNGYWKDDGSEFYDYLISEYDDLPPQFNDDDIFFYGLSERDIEDSIKRGRDTISDFVITKLADVYEYDEIDMQFDEIDSKFRKLTEKGVFDPEDVHEKADALLAECALNTGLTKEQRKHLVKLWNEIPKWYG